MQSLHSVNRVGSKSSDVALPLSRLQCYRRMRAGAAAPASTSFNARPRPVRVVVAAGSVEIATQPSADTVHLGRVLRSCCGLST